MMPFFDISRTIISEFLSDPEKRRSLRSFATSPEGRSIIGKYLDSDDGGKMMGILMPMFIERLNLEPAVRQKVLEAVIRKKQGL